MKNGKSSVQDLFLTLGATPMARKARAQNVFRRLRDGDSPLNGENERRLQNRTVINVPPEKSAGVS